jgi:hypothetical protein
MTEMDKTLRRMKYCVIIIIVLSILKIGILILRLTGMQ